jgi:hypothetical protein
MPYTTDKFVRQVICLNNLVNIAIANKFKGGTANDEKLLAPQNQ